MKRIKTETLIIGGGPAGLAAAMELSKAGKDFILIEKEPRVGGLARTYEFDEGGLIFRTDNGPHRFFSKNPRLYSFIEDLLQERWISVSRHTRQYIQGKFYDYPIRPLQALRNIGFAKAAVMGTDYIRARIAYSILRKPVSHFADYIYAHFGKSLGEFNMINYTEKIWGIPADEMHIDWANQRIKGLSLTSIAKDIAATVFKKKKLGGPATLIDSFYYPEFGTGTIYETIAQRLERGGKRIMTETRPIRILHQSGRIRSAVCSTPEGEVEISFDNLVESIPLTSFIGLLDPKAPAEIAETAGRLWYRNQVYLFITLDKASVTQDQWIYFPDESIPFARVSEMRNFSARMAPEGKTSLFVEFFCSAGDRVWNMSREELFAHALPHFISMGFFAADEVRSYYHLKEEKAYPVYDLGYKRHLDSLKAHLERFKNLYYIGRPGRFRYNNQDHSLEMGMLAAQSIIDGERYDIESIGGEDEYYEKGPRFESPAKARTR